MEFDVEHCFKYKIAYLAGIGGEKCDQCTRGYVQEAELTADHPVMNKTIPDGEQQQVRNPI